MPTSLLKYASTLPYARMIHVSDLQADGRWIATRDYKVLVPMRCLDVKEMMMRGGKYWRRHIGQPPEYWSDDTSRLVFEVPPGDLAYPAFALSECDRRLVTRQSRRWRVFGVHYLFAIPDHQVLGDRLLVKRAVYHAISRMWPKATLYVPMNYCSDRAAPPLLWVIDNPVEDPRINIVGMCHTTKYEGDTLYEYEIQVPKGDQADAGRGAAEIEALCPIQ